MRTGTPNSAPTDAPGPAPTGAPGPAPGRVPTRVPTRFRIVLRHYGALRGPLVAVALVVIALSGLVAAAPSIFARLADQEITQSTASAPTSARYLLGRPAGRIPSGPSQDPEASGLGDLDPLFGQWQDQLSALRDGLPEPLRSRVGAANWTMSYNATGLGANPAGTPPSQTTSLVTIVDPHPERVATLVDGQWPDGQFGDVPITVAVSRDTAAILGVSVGSQLGAFRIVGIFQPDDPSADYWLLNPGLLRATVDDDGNKPISTTATAYVSPQQAGMVPISGTSGDFGFTGLASTILVWYPLGLSGMTPPTADQVLAQLRGIVSAPRPMPPIVGNESEIDPGGLVDEISLSADVIDVLAASLGRIEAGSAVLMLALGGPLIAILAVLLATLLTLLRRGAAATGLLAVRGAGRMRIRGFWIGAGLLSGLPAAVLATAAVRVLFGGRASAAGLVLGIAAGLLPALLLAAAPIAATGPEAASRPAGGGRAARTGSARTGSGTVRRWRVIAEAAVLLLAAASTYLLVATGLISADGTDQATAGAAGSATATAASAAAAVTAADSALARPAGAGSGTDLLVIAAPLLLIAAAAVIVLRLYPLPLRAVAGWARRRRGAVHFLGSLRSLRDPVVGVIPVVTILAGVSVAGLSGALLTTIDTGTSGAALAALGAPIRVADSDAAGIDDERYAQVTALDSVAAASRVARMTVKPVKIPGQVAKPSAEIYLADLAALPAVQQNVPGPVPAIREPGAVTRDTPLLAVGSASLAPAGTQVEAASQQIILAATTDSLVGITRARTFLLLDSSASGFGTFRPHILLVTPAPGADPQQVADQVVQILGPTATAMTAADTAAELHTGAMATGMRLALYGAMITAAVATIAALLLSVVTATARRIRLTAILRILGLTQGQRRSLVVWEQAPVAIAALVGGAGLGIGLAALVHATVDLAPFTGGASTPPLTIDWATMAALFAGFVIVVALAVGIGILLTRRTTAATAIKLDEE